MDGYDMYGLEYRILLLIQVMDDEDTIFSHTSIVYRYVISICLMPSAVHVVSPLLAYLLRICVW